ncbi:MAG: hypothetical protein H7338_12775 [Candidatus Sericytochromatia bacterium]|nr:hypothetical protein [Candidatus Sericytochromatia bacterium]
MPIADVPPQTPQLRDSRQTSSLDALPILQAGHIPPVVVSHAFVCKANVCAFWPIVSDTDRINRLSGMTRIRLEPISNQSAARYRVHTWIGGFPMSYEELPGQWIANEWYAVRRHMLTGPLHALEMRFQLTPTSDGGTLVQYQLIIEPKLRVLVPVARFNGMLRLRRFERELRRLDSALADAQPLSWTSRKHAPDEAVLTRAAGALITCLPEAHRPIGEQLIGLVRDGADFDVTRIRPFALADTCGLDRTAALSVCLHAVMTGLLELSWELICPSCRAASTRSASLSEVPAEGHCQLCDLGFGIDLDRAVEVTFRPAPGVRSVDEGPYCIGGPARTPHVVAQAIVSVGAVVSIPVPDGPARYRRTVNIAARLQGTAKSGEIVLPRDLADQALTAEWLTGAQITETFQAELKGVSAPIGCARLRLIPAPAKAVVSR